MGPSVRWGDVKLRLTSVLFHCAVYLALCVAPPLGVALVVLLLALRKADLALDAPALVVQVERHQRVAGTFDLADQLADFVAMQQ